MRLQGCFKKKKQKKKKRKHLRAKLLLRRLVGLMQLV